MELALIVWMQTMTMFFLMIIGTMLFRYKKLSMQGSKDLGNILLYVIIPIVIIKSFCVERSEERILGLGLSFLLSCIALSVSILISFLCYGTRKPLDNFAAAFSNAGFIGIPLVQAVLNEEAVFYIVSFIVLLNLMQWTYGLRIMTNQKSTMQIKTLIKNPIIISTSIGLILFFCDISLPQIGIDFMYLLANVNTPLAMLVSGVYLAQVKVAKSLTDKRLLLTCLVRLWLIPLVILGTFYLFPGIAKEIKMAIFIASAAPVGSNIAIFASLYRSDYIYSVKTICLSTILSIVSLPCMIILAQQLL